MPVFGMRFQILSHYIDELTSSNVRRSIRKNYFNNTGDIFRQMRP
jgi:hypothetical protein